MNTTAIYPNRIRDKNEVMTYFQLPEYGSNTIGFHAEQKNGMMLHVALGYSRIVYGDHGPYIEFFLSQIRWKTNLEPKFKGNEIDPYRLPENPKYYYYWMYPKGRPDIKVYLQLKTVHDLPNAPKRADRRKSNYNRAEGYADYRIGCFYISPWDFKRKEITGI